ncbi:MAG: tRNA (guanosine(46)-N7)-methyltransferase TrmB [Hyphomicrobiaceae bacterium]
MAERLPGLRVPLEKPAPASVCEIFSPAVQALWLEIGFGGGEHLVAQARANPPVGFIGCEPFVNGVAKVLGEIERHDLTNIRLHDDDARQVINWLSNRALDRCFILFPDPWPKKRHAKRRLVAPDFVSDLARVMKPGAEFRFATDIDDYVTTGLHAVLASGYFDWPVETAGDWRIRPADWPATRYEAKAEREGRQRYYFSFRRKTV